MGGHGRSKMLVKCRAGVWCPVAEACPLNHVTTVVGKGTWPKQAEDFGRRRLGLCCALRRASSPRSPSQGVTGMGSEAQELAELRALIGKMDSGDGQAQGSAPSEEDDLDGRLLASFQAFARLGHMHDGGSSDLIHPHEIDPANFARLCKDCKLIDKAFTRIDATDQFT
eukprot:4524492-Prymnesium_polylepis.1